MLSIILDFLGLFSTFNTSALIDKILKKDNNFILATYGSLNSKLKSNVVKKEEDKWLFLNTDIVENWYNKKQLIHLRKKI